MRYWVFITTAVLTLIVFACNKSVAPAHALNGSWELRSIYGGYGPGGSNYSKGNGNIYIFTTNSYSYYLDNVLNDSGSYVITEGINPNTGEKLNAILLDSLDTIPYSINDNKLKLYSGAVAADGIIATYERIAD